MNQAQTLRRKKCVPCEGTEDPMPEAEVKHYLTVVEGWTTSDYKKIEKDFAFKNFKEATISMRIRNKNLDFWFTHMLKFVLLRNRLLLNYE